MSQSPKGRVPSVCSRRPRSNTQQAQLDSATAWLNTSDRTPETCPAQAVVDLISAETSIGNTTLSKYDPVKLTGLYALMRKIERVHMVEDLRLDIAARSEKDQTWRAVSQMALHETSMGVKAGGKQVVDWFSVGLACQQALDVTQRLREGLQWCESEFEAGILPAGAVGEERVWNEGLEVQKREGEKEKATE